MKRLFEADERTERINGQVSFFFLMLTQIGLGAAIFYKRYILGMSNEQLTDLNIITLGSAFGYWAMRLYLGGLLPVISFKKMAVIYAACVAVISIPTALIHGFPPRERWYEVLYPFIGVAVVLGGYALAAYLGKRRVEKLMIED